MIAKLIVWGENRAQALTRMRQALAQYRIVGVANNVEFLGKLVDSPAFRQADLDTGLIERESAFLFGGAEEPPPAAWFAVSSAERLAEARRMQEAARRAPDPTSPWHAVDGWRVNAPALRRWQWRAGETTRRVQARCLGEKLQLQLFDEKGESVASATAWGAMLGEDRAIKRTLNRYARRAVVGARGGRPALTASPQPVGDALPRGGFRTRASLPPS